MQDRKGGGGEYTLCPVCAYPLKFYLISEGIDLISRANIESLEVWFQGLDI